MSRPVPETILVTGGLGFLGSNIVNFLVKKAKKVIVLDINDYPAHRGNLDNPDAVSIYEADVCDYDYVLNLLLKHKVDAVIHCAAQSHVDLSFTSAHEFIYTNVHGTYSLARACRDYGKLVCFLHVSTDEVYGGFNRRYCKEDNPLEATNPYAASKAAGEMMLRPFRYTNLPLIVVRPCNLYGPRQYPEKVIPKFISRLLDGKKCEIHGSGKDERFFMWIDDAVKALWEIMVKGSIGSIYNVGNPGMQPITIRDLAVMLIEQIHPDADPEKYIDYVMDRQVNDHWYPLDCTKFMSDIWDQEHHIFSDSGGHLCKLKETIEWYTRNRNQWSYYAHALQSHSTRPVQCPRRLSNGEMQKQPLR
eukprot:Clim_evm50s253 gene=Clim_evmTU50s253